MKTLNSLVRLHKFQLDEKRQELAVIDDEIAMLEDKKVALKQKLQDEIDTISAQHNNEFSGYISGYIARVKHEQEILDTHIAKLEILADELREKVAEAFRDLKKFERAREIKQEEIEEELKHKEQNLLDEIAARKYSAGSS